MMNTPKRTPMNTRQTKRQQAMAVASTPTATPTVQTEQVPVPPEFKFPKPKEQDFNALAQGALKPTDSFDKVGVQFSPNPKNPNVMYGSFRQGAQEIKLLLEYVKTKGFTTQDIKNKENEVAFTRHSMSVLLSEEQYQWLATMLKTFADQFTMMLPVHLNKACQQSDSPLFTYEDLKFLRTQPGKETLKGGEYYYNDVKFFTSFKTDASSSTIPLNGMSAFFPPGNRSTVDVLLRPYVKINTNAKNESFFSFGFGIKAIQSHYVEPIPPPIDSFTIPFSTPEDEEMEGEPLM